MDENKFSYKEVFVKYDNVQIGVVCSKLVEKVFEYNAHDDEDASVNYVYYVKETRKKHFAADSEANKQNESIKKSSLLKAVIFLSA
jgi:hypothetical protein